MKTRAALLGCVTLLALSFGCKEKPATPPAPKSADAPAASGNHDASGPITEAALGVRIYPGAKIVTSGETDEVVSANLQTPDSAAKVLEFYRKELGLPAVGSDETLMAVKNKRTYAISVNAADGITSISIMGKK